MRNIIFYRQYFITFYNEQTEDVRRKIEWTLGIVRDFKRIPVKFLKYISGSNGLYEIRILAMNSALRLFCFFNDHGDLVILNMIKKKGDRLPANSIKLAKKLKLEYQDENKQRN